MDGQCKGRFRSEEVDCTTSNGSGVGQKQMETSSSSLIIIEMKEESRRRRLESSIVRRLVAGGRKGPNFPHLKILPSSKIFPEIQNLGPKLSRFWEFRDTIEILCNRNVCQKIATSCRELL